MRFILPFLLSLSLLTSCGEVAEGMTSEDAKVGRSILADAMKEGMAKENDPEPETKDYPIPAAFRDGEPCTIIRAQDMKALVDCLEPSDNMNNTLSGEGRMGMHVTQRCTYQCAPTGDIPIPTTMIVVDVMWNSRDAEGAGPDPINTPEELLEERNGITFYEADGNQLKAYRGYYTLRLGSGGTVMHDGKYGMEAFGRDKMIDVAEQIMEALPAK